MFCVRPDVIKPFRSLCGLNQDADSSCSNLYLQQLDPWVRVQVLSAPQMLFAEPRPCRMHTHIVTARSLRVPTSAQAQDTQVDDVHISPVSAQDCGHLEIF